MANKVGVFGGTFSPIHYGHINSILNVKEKMSLDEVRVIPAFQTPGKEEIEKPTAEQRLKLVNLGLKDYLDEVHVDSCELTRGGVSYSIDTIKELKEKNPDDILYLIIGLDQFQSFSSWKSFLEILELVNLVVTSRPGYFFPLSKDEFPDGLSPKILDFDGYTAALENGNQIYFVRLEDHDMSSSDIRKKVRLKQSINKYVPLEVENYIKEESLYSLNEGVDYDSETLLKKCKEFLVEAGGINTMSFDVRELNNITDFNVVVSAQSKKANEKLAEKLVEEIKSNLGFSPLAIDGMGDSDWVVVDYGSVMIHLFYEYVRHEYKLEALWNEYIQNET